MENILHVDFEVTEKREVELRTWKATDGHPYCDCTTRYDSHKYDRDK
jgi:hypothetical protein